MKKLITAAFAIAAIAASALSGTAHAAGSASFTLSPNSGSYTQGNGFSVQVHENGSDVNVVNAKLTYDAGKLTCTGVTGGGAFPNSVVTSCGNGSVTISRYTGMDGNGNPTTVSGDQVVGTITFTAAATGTAAVSFSSSSQIASNGSNIWNGNTNGGSYTINAPVTGGQGGGSNGGGTSTGSTGSTGSSNTSSNASAPATNSTKVATNSNASAGTSNNGAVAADETKAADNAATTSKDSKKPDDKKADSKNTSDKKSNKTWLWILLAAIVAVVAYLATRKNLQARVQDAKAAEDAQNVKAAEVVAPAAAAQATADNAAKKNTSKKAKGNKKAHGNRK